MRKSGALSLLFSAGRTWTLASRVSVETVPVKPSPVRVFPTSAAFPRLSRAVLMTVLAGVPQSGMAGEADPVPPLRRTLRQDGQR
jgi:hypothetical protein